MLNEETRLKKAHISLMRHPQTALYSGVIASGNNEVVDKKFTAYTDGINKRYSRPFIAKLSDAELRFLVLHENLHVALKHIPRHKDLWKENATLANMSADYVVNDVIISTDAKLNNKDVMFTMPEGGLYCKDFHDWSVREVYNYLKKNSKQNGGKGGDGQGNPNPNGQPNEGDESDGSVTITLPDGTKVTVASDTLDEHDWETIDGMTPDEIKKLSDDIEKKLRQGGILAGRMGANIPRAISDMLEPKIDWREVLREFVQSQMRGKDEMTWRRMNKRHMANDIYLPSVISETMGEIVVAIDTSGSIDNRQINEFASELASICETCNPESVRVLWWDTKVHGEQVFKDGDYNNLGSMLKPMGGGGTHVGCVNDYMVKESLNPECVLVFTDGYVEDNIQWSITAPTMWFVTMNKTFNPPLGGKLVMVKD
jgi:predicted metal-dependent peptidase